MNISAASLPVRNPWYTYGSGKTPGSPGPSSGLTQGNAEKASGGLAAAAGSSPYGSWFEDQERSRSIAQKKEIRDQLRQLEQEKRREKSDPFCLSKEDMVSSLLGETKTEDKKEVKENTSVNYNFRSVTAKIQQAKTSSSAGQAVLSAKRKVLELKRKLANSGADPDEITFALNHAKSIERVAVKKQRHLEMEELIARTQKRDEMLDKTEQAANDIAMAQRDLLEEKFTDSQKKFDEKQTAMFVEAMKKLKETQSDITDDMIASVDAMIDAITEEEREMLAEMSEMLENMEILDPHMSEEELKKLKTKHRGTENKEIVKADADYWKSMMKHNLEKANTPPISSGSSASPMPAMSVSIGIAAAAPSAADLVMSSFDAQA